MAKRTAKKTERTDGGGGAGKVPVNVELEPDVNAALEQWADDEQRSKRNLLAVLARKLVRLRQRQPEELQRLGLMDEPPAKK